MKALRIIYFGSLAALYVAGRITGRREIFLLFFIMLFVTLYALFLNLWTIFSFSYVQEITDNASVKGSAPLLKIGVYNDKPFPFTMMRIKVERPGKNAVLIFNLSPKSHIYFDAPLYCPYRGVYSVGITELVANDVFGLLGISFDMRRLPYYRQKILTVYPRLLPLTFLTAKLSDSKFAGGARRRLSEDGGDYSELRQYRPGDAAKRIHWKASVSRRGLFVKNFELPAESAVMIAIDNSEAAYTYENGAGGMDAGEYRLAWADLACECAAALAQYCVRSGCMVAMAEAGAGSRVMEARSQRDFTRIYDRLAAMQFGCEGDMAARLSPGGLPDISGFKAVYIISCREDAKFLAAVNNISQSGPGVKYIMPGMAREAAGRIAAAIPGASCIPAEFGADMAARLQESI